MSYKNIIPDYPYMPYNNSRKNSKIYVNRLVAPNREILLGIYSFPYKRITYHIPKTVQDLGRETTSHKKRINAFTIDYGYGY